MSARPQTMGKLGFGIGLRDALLLAWFYVHLVGSVQPHLIYHVRTPIFSLAPGFAGPLLGVSGGPVVYVSMFLAQLNAWDWLGALVMVAQAALVGILSHACFAAIAGRPVPFVRFVPLILYVMACTRYDQWSTLGPSTIGVLLCALAHTGVARRFPRAKTIVFAILAGLVYYALGGATGKVNMVLILFMFASLCGLAEFRSGQRCVRSIGWLAAYLLLAAGAAYVGERFVFAVDPADWLASWPIRRSWTAVLPAALYLCCPAIGALLVLGGRAQGWMEERARRRGAHAAPAEEASSAARRRAALDPRLRWLLATAVLLWMVLGAVSAAGDAPMRRAAEISCAGMNGHWSEVLEAARALPEEEYTILTEHDVHMALFHTGRLGDDLFSYPRVTTDILLDLEEPPDLEYVWRVADGLLRLGRVNDAQHLSSEALAMLGSDPRVLRHLAMIHLVKGQVASARVFLNALSYDVVQGKWANGYLRRLDHDPGLAEDPEVQRLRKVALVRDDVAEITLVQEEPVEDAIYLQEPMLQNLLKKDPTNRMAFEFLMGLCLLKRRPDLVAANLHRLGDIGQARIPRAWQEALVLYTTDTGRSVDLQGRALDREVVERYRRFRDAVARCRGGRGAAREQTRPEFGDTYFYYFRFGVGADR